MKKLFLTAIIAFSISMGVSAQTANQIDKTAVGNFEATYLGASNVEWSSKDKFSVATFTLKQHKVDVFYNEAGTFVATTTQINTDEIPSIINKRLEKKFAGYTIKEAFKFEAEDETAYFISLENDKENIVLKVKESAFSLYSQESKS